MKSGDSARQKLVMGNRKHARMRWGSQLNKVHLSTLTELSMQFGFSLAIGDLMLARAAMVCHSHWSHTTGTA